MKKFLMYLWQLPQNIIGFLLSRSSKNKMQFPCYDGEVVTVYFTNNVFGAGVSLGNYIILDNRYYGLNHTQDINHEHGHQIQSRRLGWFYLPSVGLISALRNIYDRLLHRHWSTGNRIIFYYSGWPESEADELGKVLARW